MFQQLLGETYSYYDMLFRKNDMNCIAKSVQIIRFNIQSKDEEPRCNRIHITLNVSATLLS